MSTKKTPTLSAKLDPDSAIKAIRSVPLLSESEIKEIRASLCDYEPSARSRDEMLKRLTSLPGITGTDLARVKAALCLYDPER